MPVGNPLGSTHQEDHAEESLRDILSTVRLHTLFTKWKIVIFATSAGIVTVCVVVTQVALAGRFETISTYISVPVEVVKRAVRVDVVVDMYWSENVYAFQGTTATSSKYHLASPSVYALILRSAAFNQSIHGTGYLKMLVLVPQFPVYQ